MKLHHVLMIALAFGCAGLDGLTSSSGANANRPLCASEDDGKQWDLGTGYAFDVRHSARARRCGSGALARDGSRERLVSLGLVPLAWVAAD